MDNEWEFSSGVLFKYVDLGKLETTNSPYAMAKLTAIEIGDTMTKQFGHKAEYQTISLFPHYKKSKLKNNLSI